MTEYCFQSSKSSTKNNNNNNSKFSNFSSLCSLILSHPLYFSYFIFFSPYLFKLLSFLSPLFFTTSLLILSLLTTLIPLHSIINSNEGLLLTAYNSLLENLQPDFGDEDCKSTPIEEFEVYKAVFEIPTIEVSAEIPVEFEQIQENPFENEQIQGNPVENEQIQGNPVENEQIQGNPVEFFEEKVDQDGGKRTGNKCENLTMEEEQEENKVRTKPKKVKEEDFVKIIESKRGSEAIKMAKSRSSSQIVGERPYMGSFGSMRKEKEWRRTLACKLFEERHNGSNTNMAVNGGGGRSEEGMDLLWETYEAESKTKLEEVKKGKRKDKMQDLILMKVNEDLDDDDDDDDDEDDDHNGKFCCLQALKLSAGKMNLSMGMKISKAFKGIGLLQSHVRKQGKKGTNKFF